MNTNLFFNHFGSIAILFMVVKVYSFYFVSIQLLAQIIFKEKYSILYYFIHNEVYLASSLVHLFVGYLDFGFNKFNKVQVVSSDKMFH